MTPRHYTDVMRVNGRPAMVRVHVHPSTGQPQIDPDSIEYLDGEFSEAQRAKLTALYQAINAPCPTPEQHRQECAAQLEQAEEYRSPFPAILMILGCVGAVLFAVLGAAAFGTGPLTLPAMLSGAALWAAAYGSGWVAWRSYKAATR